MSSVAGERVRRSNFVYGSTKAGLDGFYLGLGRSVAEFGVRVLVDPARPGAHHHHLEHWKATGARRRRSRSTRRTSPSWRSTSAGKGKDLIWAQPGALPDVGDAAHPAADLPQTADLR